MGKRNPKISPEAPLVLITGATGSIGPRVAEAMSEAGYRLRTLSSNSMPDELLPRDSDNRVGDITDNQSVANSMQGVNIVVHLAAFLHITEPSPSMTTKYQKINIGGTRNVVKAAEQEGVQRLVYFSTIAVYGESPGEVATEETKPAPSTEYAKTKLDAESIVLAARNREGSPLGTVLRLAAAYGPRVKGNYRRLLMTLNSAGFYHWVGARTEEL